MEYLLSWQGELECIMYVRKTRQPCIVVVCENAPEAVFRAMDISRGLEAFITNIHPSTTASYACPKPSVSRTVFTRPLISPLQVDCPRKVSNLCVWLEARYCKSGKGRDKWIVSAPHRELC